MCAVGICRGYVSLVSPSSMGSLPPPVPPSMGPVLLPLPLSTGPFCQTLTYLDAPAGGIVERIVKCRDRRPRSTNSTHLASFDSDILDEPVLGGGMGLAVDWVPLHLKTYLWPDTDVFPNR